MRAAPQLAYSESTHQGIKISVSGIAEDICSGRVVDPRPVRKPTERRK